MKRFVRNFAVLSAVLVFGLIMAQPTYAQSGSRSAPAAIGSGSRSIAPVQSQIISPPVGSGTRSAQPIITQQAQPLGSSSRGVISQSAPTSVMDSTIIGQPTISSQPMISQPVISQGYTPMTTFSSPVQSYSAPCQSCPSYSPPVTYSSPCIQRSTACPTRAFRRWNGCCGF